MSSESQTKEAVKVFYSYSHKDERFRNKLDNHLALLQRQGFISEWHDRMIEAGDDWESEINTHLDRARIILLLVSDDFIASDYCYSVEMERALERHKRGEALVISIILRPVDWESSPLGKLQVLPKDAKPVTLWKNRDEAFKNVAQGIRQVIKNFTPKEAESTVPTLIPRPPIIGFVARRDEQGRDIIERLKADLAPHRNQLITLSGPGGVGKTTLAAETARALKDDFKDRLVWTSADGRTDFTLSNLLDDIATQLGHPELRPLVIDEKVAQVHALVADPPALVMLDNYETISEEAKRHIETWFVQAQCSALLTSRHRINQTHNIRIAAMSPAEARDFLERLIAETQDAQIFSEAIGVCIYETAEANPFVMQWIVAQIDEAKEPDTVLEELKHGEGDAAQRVFDRSFNLPQLGEDGQAVLLALSLFAPSASRAALAEVAGFGNDLKRLNEPLKNLRALWLIKALDENRRFTIEGLTRSLAHARLTRDIRADEFRHRFVEHFLRHAVAHKQTTPEDFDALEAEKDNLLSAIDVASDLNYWLSIMVIRSALERFLDLRGYWDEAIRRGEQALQAARSAATDEGIAQFAHNLAMIHYRRGGFEEARRLYDESLEIKKRLDNQRGIAVTLHNLAIIAQEQGELDEARRLYDESLEINKRLGNQSGIANTLHQLARLAQEQGELDEARRLYDESLEINKRLDNQSGIAVTLHNLAIIAQEQGELGEARRLCDESLEINKRLGDQRGIAETLHELARLAQAQEETAEARRLCEESLKIRKRLGDQKGIGTTLGLLGLLAENEGNRQDAIQFTREALSIFEKLKSPYAGVARRQLERLEGEDS